MKRPDLTPVRKKQPEPEPPTVAEAEAKSSLVDGEPWGVAHRRRQALDSLLEENKQSPIGTFMGKPITREQIAAIETKQRHGVILSDMEERLLAALDSLSGPFAMKPSSSTWITREQIEKAIGQFIYQQNVALSVMHPTSIVRVVST